MGLADIPAVSFEDDLTGLYNRRFSERYLSSQIDWKNPAPNATSFILVDIDEFHRANDLYGHAEGDHILQDFARRLRKTFRSDDVIARDSGDSFFVILPRTPRDEAARLATLIVADIAKNPLRTHRDNFPVELTASAGVVSFPEDGSAPEAIRTAAEKVLYHAKRTGHNRVSVGGAIDETLAAEREVFAGLPCREFCGRQTELEAALSLLSELEAGRTSVLFVQGPAGVGKSRFLREIAQAATARRILYLHVICNESQRQSLGHSLVYLVDQFYRLHPNAQQDLREALFPAQRRMARELIPSLSGWEGENTDVPPSERKIVVLGMLENAILAMSRRSPLLILLDNSRHCDRGTLDVLRRILCDKKARVAVAFSLKGDVRGINARTDQGLHDLVQELERVGIFQALTLVPLRREDVSAMVQSILPNSDVQAPFQELLFEKSGGNPLYVEEAIRALILRERIRRQGDRYAIDAVPPDELPSSLDAMIEQVISTLSSEAGELVTNAAIIGSRFDLQVLQEVMGKREGETLDAVERVESTKLIEHLERGSGDDYAFNSSTARDVTFVRNPDEARKMMQRRLAAITRQRAVPVPSGPPGLRPGPSRPAPPEKPPAEAAPVGRPPKIPEGTTKLSADAVRRALDFMRALSALLRIGRLYPQWSQTGSQFSAQLQQASQALLQQAGVVTFAVDPKGILFNGHPAEGIRAADVLSDFNALLSERLIASLTLAPELEPRELDALVAALAAPLQRSRVAADHWDQFLEREDVRHVDILQRGYVARELETRGFKRGTFQERPLAPEEVEALRTSLRHFKAASENLRLYPPGHALVEESQTYAVQSMAGLLSRVHILTLAAASDGLIVNGRPIDSRTVGDGGAFLSQQLEKRNLKSLTLVEGLRPQESQALISVFAVPPEDASWKKVLQAAAEGEAAHFDFGGLEYAQITAAAGGVVPAGPVKQEAAVRAPEPGVEFRVAAGAPPKVLAIRPAAPAAPEPAAETVFEEAEEWIPVGVPVRADVRARAYLKAPPERLVSPEFERELPALLEVLNYGWTAQLAGQLAGRVAELLRDPNMDYRQRALVIVGRALIETATVEAKTLLFSRTQEPLGAILAAELEAPVLRQAAETLSGVIAAALPMGRADLAADLLLKARKRIDAKTAPPAFKETLARKLQELAGPKGALAAALRSATPDLREAALRISGMFGPAMAPVLADFILENEDAGHRRAAAAALKEIGGAAGADLARHVTSSGPPERLVRVLSVLEVSGTQGLAAPVLAAFDHPDLAVRDAGTALLKRADRASAAAVLKRLVSSDRQDFVLRGLALAAELAIPEVGLEITRLAQSSNDESLVRVCCEFFQKVKVPSAVPALRRVFEARAKMFGLVKGFSDETRALAVKAAAGVAHQDARELVEEAKRDKSPAVRSAAGG